MRGERKKEIKVYIRRERPIVGKIKKKGWCGIKAKGSSSFACRNHTGANYSL